MKEAKKKAERTGPAGIALTAAAVLAFALVLAAAFMFIPPRTRGQEVSIVIERGMDAKTVSRLLADRGLVRSAAVFDIFLKITGTDTKIKAGRYRIKGGAGIAALIDILGNGRTASAEVTFPEGMTASEIAALLEQKGICLSGDFIRAVGDRDLCRELGLHAASAEGYLFPDTYFLDEGSDAADIVSRMVNNFKNRLAAISPEAQLDSKSLHEKVILASIVEREYRSPEEAPLIASVFRNRLEIRMPLQSCATVVYVLTEKLGRPRPKTVTYADLSIPDPYNTYLHYGLPPGPISNPGTVSLEAALGWKKTEYLYFRLEDADNGLHRFSKTFEEHSQAAIPVKGL